MPLSRQRRRLHNVMDLLLPLVEQKRLLDIGCIGHDFRVRRKIGTFYLDTLCKVAFYAKGIDILEADVALARSEGYEVEVGDAETFEDGSRYDVIFAGELIEHLGRPGAFLECACRNLEDSGTLVITTPNTFSFSRLLRCITHLTNEPPLNPEHTCYFTPATLEQLASRYGLMVRELFYSDYDYGGLGMKPGRAVFLRINRFLSNLLPQFSQSFVVTLIKA